MSIVRKSLIASIDEPESEELVFDDQPIGSLLGKGKIEPPTPGDAIEMWLNGREPKDRTAIARAVAGILYMGDYRASGFAEYKEVEACLRLALEEAEKSSVTDETGRAALLSAVGAIAQLDGRLQEAERLFKTALELQRTNLGAEHPETCATANRLAMLLDHVGRKQDAERLRRSLSLGQLLREEQDGTALRLQALELFLAGEFDEAEGIYKHLASMGFELASTHCHLSRIYLITSRFDDAVAEADRAWAQRRDADAYIIPRILFLRLVCKMVKREPIRGILQDLERALQEPGSCSTWTMQPVVQSLTSRLTDEEIALLSALVEALSESKNLRLLRDLPLWRDANGPED